MKRAITTPLSEQPSPSPKAPLLLLLAPLSRVWLVKWVIGLLEGHMVFGTAFSVTGAVVNCQKATSNKSDNVENMTLFLLYGAVSKPESVPKAGGLEVKVKQVLPNP